LTEIDWSEFDFVDFGCSRGGSIRHCQERFGATRGLGVDLNEQKVEETRRAGFDAVVADATKLEGEDEVSFVSMLDFLEHLRNLRVVKRAIATAARLASDFLYIKHPSFEGKELVEAAGVRQYWWDWHGHKTHIRIADYCTIFDRLGLSTYMIRYVERIEHSGHPSIVSTEMPRDLTRMQAEAVTDVPLVQFSPPLWRRQDIFVALRPFDPGEWAEITRPTGREAKAVRVGSQGG
jgi:SAM-dependent methyltransferase